MVLEDIKKMVQSEGCIGSIMMIKEKNFSQEELEEMEQLGIMDPKGRVRISLLYTLSLVGQA